MPKVVVVLLAGTALLALALLWSPTAREQTTTAIPAGPVGAALPAAVEPARPRQPPAPPAAEPTTPVATRAPATTPPAPPPPRDAFTAHYAAMLEARFQRDKPSSTNAQLERDLRTKITAAMPKPSRLDALECRHALCRVRTSHPDESTYQDYLAHVFVGQDPTTRVWPGQVWVAVPADTTSSPVISSVYLGIGEELPP